MNGQPQAFAQDDGKPAMAVLSRPSGASAFAPPLRARVGQLLGQSKVRIPAILAAAIQSQAEFTRKQAASSAAAAQLAETVGWIESVATSEQWSQRRLAAKLGLSPRTWRRVRNFNVNAVPWLPQLRAALATLKPGLNAS